LAIIFLYQGIFQGTGDKAEMFYFDFCFSYSEINDRTAAKDGSIWVSNQNAAFLMPFFVDRM
jgi:hypothetical protein